MEQPYDRPGSGFEMWNAEIDSNAVSPCGSASYVVCLARLPIHDRRKGLRIEAGSAY